MFADDLVIWTTGKYRIIAKAKLKRYLLTLQTYCRLWKLKIYNKKTVYSIFTLSQKMARKTLQLNIDGEKLEKEDNPVYLGVKLDCRMALTCHRGFSRPQWQICGRKICPFPQFTANFITFHEKS